MKAVNMKSVNINCGMISFDPGAKIIVVGGRGLRLSAYNILMLRK
jgi:hypothetical protein